MGAGYRVRTDDIQLGKGEGTGPGSSSELHVTETIGLRAAHRSSDSQREGRFRRDFAAGLLLENGRDDDRLLSVREVALLLGLCTATIYGLCADGALAHVRILNTIRFHRADVRSFIVSRTGATE